MQRLAVVLLSASALFAAEPYRSDFSKETPGAEPTTFLSVVGNWSIVQDDGKNVLRVDGREWKRGNPAAGLADKARAIYGSKHEEFIDNVKAFAYFPYAVAKGVEEFKDGELTVRFKLIGGALDQCAGILFNLKPNGDYLTVRFNDKEDNVVLWKFESGKRSFVKRGDREVPLPMQEWHTLTVSVKGTEVVASLDGKKILEHTWKEPIAGKIGLWAKTDSVTEFDGFGATPK
jgi:hypothetical protein